MVFKLVLDTSKISSEMDGTLDISYGIVGRTDTRTDTFKNWSDFWKFSQKLFLTNSNVTFLSWQQKKDRTLFKQESLILISRSVKKSNIWRAYKPTRGRS